MANRRFATRVRKRVTSWHGAIVDMADFVVGTAQSLVLVTEATMEAFPTPTIVRLRGNLACTTDISSTPGGVGVLVVGAIVVTANAFAVPVVPSPATDIGSDFLWWNAFEVGASATDVIGEEITIHRMQVDSKAMRKVGLNELLVLVAQLVTCEGTMVVNLCGSLRVLLKAP